MSTDVQLFVARHGKPKVASISDDTHIFHFEEDGTWEASPVILVNRNGNHFRLMEQTDGSWLHAKTWSSLFEPKGWEIEHNLRRKDARQLIDLCGVGPQGNKGKPFETLCLLPREATTGGRKAVWRQHMIDVRFDRSIDGFSLSVVVNGNLTSKSFTGKLWESKPASDWCAALLNHVEPKIQKGFAPPPPPEVVAKQVAVMQDSPLWGMF